MFTCSCGGVLLVEEIEKYPDNLDSKSKLDYERKCTGKCPDCGTVYDQLKYD